MAAVKVRQAYRFFLDPSPAQERMLRSHAGQPGLPGIGDWRSARSATRPSVAGMTRNHKLARAIADQGFGAARRMLAYKTAWHGGRLILASRWYPSSKICSSCGAVKAKLPLSERMFHCRSCGLVIGQGPQRRAQLLVPRYRQWGGNRLRQRRGERLRSCRETQPGRRMSAMIPKLLVTFCNGKLLQSYALTRIRYS